MLEKVEDIYSFSLYKAITNLCHKQLVSLLNAPPQDQQISSYCDAMYSIIIHFDNHPTETSLKNGFEGKKTSVRKYITVTTPFFLCPGLHLLYFKRGLIIQFLHVSPFN